MFSKIGVGVLLFVAVASQGAVPARSEWGLVRCYWQVCELMPDLSSMVCGIPKQGDPQDAIREFYGLPGRGHIFNSECVAGDSKPMLDWKNSGHHILQPKKKAD